MQVKFFTKPIYKSAKTSHIAFASYLAKIAQQIGLEPVLKTESSLHPLLFIFNSCKYLIKSIFLFKI